MASIGIRIVYAGNQSLPGHMYVVFKGDDGSVETFGHYPDSGLDGLGGPGGVRGDDLKREQKTGAPGTDGVPNVARDFPVPPGDFQRARDYARDAASQRGDPSKKWGQYDPLYRSCVDFTWNVARQAGLRKDKWFEGYPLPSWNKGAVDDAYYEFFRRPEFNKEFRRGVNWTQPRDPLVLDLDGDGIELTSSDSTVLFDHNADNIKTGTQWAKSDDGMLVRDLNGNGTIDSGRELFGDQTRLPNGQLATNGFQALSALDSNGDSMMDANDAAFAELKVWRDLNQDGISQTNELQGLSQASITSINLTANAQGASTFTKAGVDANGNTTSTTQAVKNFNFTTNDFYREFTNTPAVTDTASALPQMQGAGQVRDLREAMSLGTAQSQALEQTLNTYHALAVKALQSGLSGSGWDGAAQLADLMEVSFNTDQSAAMQYLQLKLDTDAGNLLNGTNAADILVGRGGNDTLAGSTGADILIGGAGNDTLIGGQGNDQLVGGQGNDSLDGQWGNDTYFWGRGQGNDSIKDTLADANGQNIVVLRGINPQDIQVSLLAEDDYRAVRITIADTGETLMLRSSNYIYWNGGSAAPVNVIFADGTQWDMNELVRQSLPLPTDGNDTLVGTLLDDLPSRLNGEAGDDLSCAHVRKARSREKLRGKVGSSPRGISVSSYRKCSGCRSTPRIVLDTVGRVLAIQKIESYRSMYCVAVVSDKAMI